MKKIIIPVLFLLSACSSEVTPVVIPVLDSVKKDTSTIIVNDTFKIVIDSIKVDTVKKLK